jgi:hypothetical protein
LVSPFVNRKVEVFNSARKDAHGGRRKLREIDKAKLASAALSIEQQLCRLFPSQNFPNVCGSLLSSPTALPH